MFKFVKVLRDIRLFVYIAIITFQIQTILQVGIEIFSGKANEITFYKVLSFVWATLALLCLKAMYEMWRALKEATNDINALKEKGRLQEVRDPFQVLGSQVGTNGIPITMTQEAMEKLQLVDFFLDQKGKNESNN